MDEIITDLLKKPYSFWNYINEMNFTNNIPQMDKLIKEDKYINEILPGISFVTFIEIIGKFNDKIKQIKEWLLRSDVRAKTFYYLGILNIATSSKIAEILGKHPKGVSTYLHEFEEKNWVESIGDQGSKTKPYRLSEIGMDFLKIANDSGWFNDTLDDTISVEHTIMKIDYEQFPTDEDGILLDSIQGPFGNPPIHFLIDRIQRIVLNLLEKMNLRINVPSIRPYKLRLEEHELTRERKLMTDMILVGTINEDELALIFAAFNFLQHFEIPLGDIICRPYICQLRFVSVDHYFSDHGSEEDFLTYEETKAFISKTLAKMREKYHLKS